jgi:hypothetical protein
LIFDILVAHAAGQPQLAVEQREVGLGERREAAEVGRRHPDAAGRDQPLLGGVIQGVEASVAVSASNPGMARS